MKKVLGKQKRSKVGNVILEDRRKIRARDINLEVAAEEDKLDHMGGFEKSELKAYSSGMIRTMRDFSKWKFKTLCVSRRISWPSCTFKACRHII